MALGEPREAPLQQRHVQRPLHAEDEGDIVEGAVALELIGNQNVSCAKESTLTSPPAAGSRVRDSVTLFSRASTARANPGGRSARNSATPNSRRTACGSAPRAAWRERATSGLEEALLGLRSRGAQCFTPQLGHACSHRGLGEGLCCASRALGGGRGGSELPVLGTLRRIHPVPLSLQRREGSGTRRWGRSPKRLPVASGEPATKARAASWGEPPGAAALAPAALASP